MDFCFIKFVVNRLQMKIRNLPALLFVVITLFSGRNSYAQNPGDVLFGMNGIHVVNISFTQVGWWDSLLNNKTLSDQNGIDYYLSGSVTIDGNPLDSVGVRLKG